MTHFRNNGWCNTCGGTGKPDVEHREARQVIKDEVHEWLLYNFPNEDRVSAALGLCEEVGEVARAVLKQHQGIRGTYEEWDNEIRKELADTYWKIFHVAVICDVDLEEAAAWRWEELKTRDWIKNPTGHGIVSRTEDT